jgi:lipopolysaccharide/colanic/teichoic acid biosynthesis glycosyltransferase
MALIQLFDDRKLLTPHRIPVAFRRSQRKALPNLEVGAHLRRIGDLVIAWTLMVVTLPFFASAALAIKLESSGPVFTPYQRVGCNGRQITVLQFRTTMPPPQPRDRPMCWDMPTTRMGRFLCSIRLASLSQLINVLRGELTILGPERERPDFLRA